MATFSSSDIAFIREQIRILVDPLIMRLRTELYGGDVYGTITVNRLPAESKLEADEVIAQIESNGDIVSAYTTLTAGPEGIQSGKLLAHTGTVVVHADITNINHAGRIVGIAKEAASAGTDVKIQQYGVYSNSAFNFSQTGSVLPGVNGSLSLSLDSNAAFSQFVGVALSVDTLFITLLAEAIIV